MEEPPITALGDLALARGRWRGFMQIDLNIEHNEVYERGAALLTVLACAKEVGDERSLQLYLSLCGKALWLRHLENPDDWTPVTVKPQYMFRDRKVIDRDVAYVAKHWVSAW